jgi:hypothetical protein
VKASDPTLDNDGNALVAGALYFSSTENIMKVYDGASWIAATSAGNVSLLQYEYTATLGQTTFSGADDNSATLSYTVNNLIVTLNGVVLDNGGDYTATNGTSVVLTSGAAAGDLLQVIAFKSFTVADMVPASTGGTFSGNVAVNGNLTVDTNTLFVDAASNNVGIGTNSPSTRLTVSSSGANGLNLAVDQGNAIASARLFFTNGTAGQGYSISNDTGSLKFNRAATAGSSTGTESMRIDALGRLLVGYTTNQDGAALQIDANAVGSAVYTGRFANSSTSTSAYNAVRWEQGAPGSARGMIGTGGSAVANSAFQNNFVVGTQTSSPLVFSTNDTERCRVDASGNLLVGSTLSSVSTGTGFKFVASATDPYCGQVVTSSTGSHNTYHLYSLDASAYRFYVSAGGQIYATSTSISGISDVTLKENIRELDTGLAAIMALQPRRFDWKNGDGQNLAGFVAQEVEQVLPDLVSEYVYDVDNNGTKTMKKSLKMGDILPTLVKAMQEQQAIIEALEARISALEGETA